MNIYPSLKQKLHNKKISTQEEINFECSLSKVEDISALYLLALLQKNSIFCNIDKSITSYHIGQALKVDRKYYPLIESLLEMLTRRKLVSRTNQGNFSSATNKTLSIDYLNMEFELVINENPNIKSSTYFIKDVLASYLSLLRSETDFLSIMFPNGALDRIKSIYNENPVAAYYNNQTSKIVQLYTEKLINQHSSQPSIIEIGAGVGMTAMKIIPILEAKGLNYLYEYTDISNAFVAHGQSQLKRYNSVSFKKLNIELEPSLQSFQINHYDIIIATNVLHATKNLSRTLHHIKLLLKPNGLLVLNEGVRKRDYSTVTYGLSDGWWRFEDAHWRIDGSPLVTTKDWKTLLAEAGFSEIHTLGALTGNPSATAQEVFISC